MFSVLITVKFPMSNTNPVLAECNRVHSVQLLYKTRIKQLKVELRLS